MPSESSQAQSIGRWSSISQVEMRLKLSTSISGRARMRAQVAWRRALGVSISVGTRTPMRGAITSSAVR